MIAGGYRRGDRVTGLASLVAFGEAVFRKREVWFWVLGTWRAMCGMAVRCLVSFKC